MLQGNTIILAPMHSWGDLEYLRRLIHTLSPCALAILTPDTANPDQVIAKAVNRVLQAPLLNEQESLEYNLVFFQTFIRKPISLIVAGAKPHYLQLLSQFGMPLIVVEEQDDPLPILAAEHLGLENPTVHLLESLQPLIVQGSLLSNSVSIADEDPAISPPIELSKHYRGLSLLKRGEHESIRALNLGKPPKTPGPTDLEELLIHTKLNAHNFVQARHLAKLGIQTSNTLGDPTFECRFGNVLIELQMGQGNFDLACAQAEETLQTYRIHQLDHLLLLQRILLNYSFAFTMSGIPQEALRQLRRSFGSDTQPLLEAWAFLMAASGEFQESHRFYQQLLQSARNLYQRGKVISMAIRVMIDTEWAFEAKTVSEMHLKMAKPLKKLPRSPFTLAHAISHIYAHPDSTERLGQLKEISQQSQYHDFPLTQLQASLYFAASIRKDLGSFYHHCHTHPVLLKLPVDGLNTLIHKGASQCLDLLNQEYIRFEHPAYFFHHRQLHKLDETATIGLLAKKLAGDPTPSDIDFILQQKVSPIQARSLINQILPHSRLEQSLTLKDRLVPRP